MPLIGEAHRRGIPVVCVNTDAPGSERLCTVSVDAAASGGLAGELMGRFLGGQGTVVVVTGFSTTIDHAEKQQGFVRALREGFPEIELAAVVEAHDDETEAYLKCVDTFAASPTCPAIYVTTANSPPVMRALADRRQAARVTTITTDLFPALVPLIQTGHIAATIDQRPFIQGADRLPHHAPLPPRGRAPASVRAPGAARGHAQQPEAFAGPAGGGRRARSTRAGRPSRHVVRFYFPGFARASRGMRSPRFEQAMTTSSRRARVASCFADRTQNVATRR